jgi:hypothetical protein
MRRFVAFAVLLIASPLSAAQSAKYKMHGPCHVRTTSGPSFDETFERDMEATVSGPDDDLKIVITGKDHAPCTLKGTRKKNEIKLPKDQVCSQDIAQNGVKAKVTGVLASGHGTLNGKHLTLVTKWNVEGEVDLTFKKLPVKGVVDADVKGTRVNAK